MYELIQVGNNTFYMDSPNKIGFYRYDNNKIYLIDSGNGRDYAKKVLKILDEKGWELEGIINTHSHADHIGGNDTLEKRTGCKISTNEIEHAFTKYTILEPAFIYGAYPPKRLQKKFLMAKPSNASVDFNNIPEGLDIINLPGHSYDMIGVKTDDNVYFIGDSLFPKEVLNKYHIATIYDIKNFLRTLDYLEKLKGDFFIPTHAEASSNLKNLIELNRNKVFEIINLLLDILKRPLSLNVITKKVFDYYQIEINYVQYHLVEGTLKAFISYLIDEKKVDVIFDNNFLLYCLREN